MHRLISLFVLIAFFLTVSCTASKPHPIHTTLPQEKVRGIKVGDTVKVKTLSGEQYKFKVEKITNAEIAGDGVQIDLVDIDGIRKVYITGRTVAIVVGTIVVVAALIFLGSRSGYRGDRRYVENSK